MLFFCFYSRDQSHDTKDTCGCDMGYMLVLIFQQNKTIIISYCYAPVSISHVGNLDEQKLLNELSVLGSW